MTSPTLKSAAAAGPFTLPALAYAEDALAPIVSARTLSFHYGKHHNGYVDKLNELVAGTPFADLSLEEVVKETAKDKANAKIFNNAAQAWNHDLYWKSLSPKPTGPSGALRKAIEASFGNIENLKTELTNAAVNHFASGWAWLVAKNNKLVIVDTHDAHTPLEEGATCLLTVDVWEHAYYLDRQNDRKAYVKAVVDGLLNWDFASANFEK